MTTGAFCAYNSLMPSSAVNLDELSPKEKLELLERLWESLTRSPEQVPVTEAQRRELDRRLDELGDGAPDGIPWDRVLREIEGRSG